MGMNSFCYCEFWSDKVQHCFWKPLCWNYIRTVSILVIIKRCVNWNKELPKHHLFHLNMTINLPLKVMSTRPQQSTAITWALLIKRQCLFTVNISRDAIVTDESTKLRAEVTQTVIWISALPYTHSTPFTGSTAQNYFKRAIREFHLAGRRKVWWQQRIKISRTKVNAAISQVLESKLQL